MLLKLRNVTAVHRASLCTTRPSCTSSFKRRHPCHRAAAAIRLRLTQRPETQNHCSSFGTSTPLSNTKQETIQSTPHHHVTKASLLQPIVLHEKYIVPPSFDDAHSPSTPTLHPTATPNITITPSITPSSSINQPANQPVIKSTKEKGYLSNPVYILRQKFKKAFSSNKSFNSCFQYDKHILYRTESKHNNERNEWWTGCFVCPVSNIVIYPHDCITSGTESGATTILARTDNGKMYYQRKKQVQQACSIVVLNYLSKNDIWNHDSVTTAADISSGSSSSSSAAAAAAGVVAGEQQEVQLQPLLEFLESPSPDSTTTTSTPPPPLSSLTTTNAQQIKQPFTTLYKKYKRIQPHTLPDKSSKSQYEQFKDLFTYQMKLLSTDERNKERNEWWTGSFTCPISNTIIYPHECMRSGAQIENGKVYYQHKGHVQQACSIAVLNYLSKNDVWNHDSAATNAAALSASASSASLAGVEGQEQQQEQLQPLLEFLELPSLDGATTTTTTTTISTPSSSITSSSSTSLTTTTKIEEIKQPSSLHVLYKKYKRIKSLSPDTSKFENFRDLFTYEMKSLSINNDKRRSEWWTCTFTCPMTGRVFSPASVSGYDSIEKDGIVYYKRKTNVKNACSIAVLEYLEKEDIWEDAKINSAVALVEEQQGQGQRQPELQPLEEFLLEGASTTSSSTTVPTTATTKQEEQSISVDQQQEQPLEPLLEFLESSSTDSSATSTTSPTLSSLAAWQQPTSKPFSTLSKKFKRIKNSSKKQFYTLFSYQMKFLHDDDDDDDVRSEWWTGTFTCPLTNKNFMPVTTEEWKRATKNREIPHCVKEENGIVYYKQKKNIRDACSIAVLQYLEEEDIWKDKVLDLPTFDSTNDAKGASSNVVVPDAKLPTQYRNISQEGDVGKNIPLLLSMLQVKEEHSSPLPSQPTTTAPSKTKDDQITKSIKEATQTILHENDIPYGPFPQNVLECLPPSDYKITLEEGRLDLRHLPIFSIDPPGCSDIDDALHCIILPNGNYQMGVHIADVTHFVKAGTPLDFCAANRSTTTYLVNERFDMLPTLLTTDLCSLREKVDRFAFSVLWEVSPQGKIVKDAEFHKSVIHSIASLTYKDAQELIDEPDQEHYFNRIKDEVEEQKDVQLGGMKRLASLARIFRDKRANDGALTLASSEIDFTLDEESLNPTDVQSYEFLESNRVVEEFMLLANVTVAKKILKHFPKLSILRRHEAPDPSKFKELVSKAKCRGFHIEIEDSKHLADSLDKAVIEDDPYFNNLLRIQATRCMTRAQYFSSGQFKPKDWHHYGLAAPVYTHFTSPIRRYADVCVHRLLAASIGVEPLPAFLSSKTYLQNLAANMNRRHHASKIADRSSTKLHSLIILLESESEPKLEDAYVLDVDTREYVVPSFNVIVPKYGLEGRVSLPDNFVPFDDHLHRDAQNHRVEYKNIKDGKEVSSTRVQVFDKVRVKVWVEQKEDTQKELALHLVHPKFESNLSKVESDHTNEDNTSGQASSFFQLFDKFRSYLP